MNVRFCLLFVLLACSKRQEPENVCRVEAYHLAQDANGKVFDIADARTAPKVTGFPLNRPTYLTFQQGGRIMVDWMAFDLGTTQQLEYQPGSPKAKIISRVDAGVIGTYAIRVEGSPPRSVTLGFETPICSAGSEPQTCADETEEKMVFATYTCAEERL